MRRKDVEEYTPCVSQAGRKLIAWLCYQYDWDCWVLFRCRPYQDVGGLRGSGVSAAMRICKQDSDRHSIKEGVPLGPTFPRFPKRLPRGAAVIVQLRRPLPLHLPGGAAEGRGRGREGGSGDGSAGDKETPAGRTSKPTGKRQMQRRGRWRPQRRPPGCAISSATPAAGPACALIVMCRGTPPLPPISGGSGSTSPRPTPSFKGWGIWLTVETSGRLQLSTRAAAGSRS
jgi:hypothetical protein